MPFVAVAIRWICGAAETEDTYFCLSACSFTVTLPMSLYNVLKWVDLSPHCTLMFEFVFFLSTALWASSSFLLFPRAYRSNSLKHHSLYEAFLPFLSPVLLFVLSTIWTEFSPSNIMDLQPRMFYLMVGTAFANVTVSSSRFLQWQLLLAV